MKEKLEKLTPDQEIEVVNTRDFWMNYIFSCKNSINKEKAKIGINWLYKFSGKKEPVVIYVDSPIGCQLAVLYLKEFQKQYPQIIKVASVRASFMEVRASVMDSVMDSVRASFREVMDSVRVSVMEVREVMDSVRVSVMEVRDSVRDNYEPFSYYGNIGDYGWVSFYDFFTKIGVLNNSDFNSFKDILLSGVYDMIQLEGFCIVSNLPDRIERDFNGKLHSENKSAIHFRDGYELYYWHGINVPEKWILNPEKIAKEDVINDNNVEKRRALMEIIGETAYAEMLDLVAIETDSYNGQEIILFKTKQRDNLTEDYIYFIKVICNSTNRKYYICIPEEAADMGALGALSWTFGLNKEDYQLLIET